MLRQIALAAAVVVGAAAASFPPPTAAGAMHRGTTFIMPDGPAKTLYESWVAQSLVPTAPVAVEIHSHNCDKYDVAACTDTFQRPMIVVTPDIAYLFDTPGSYSDSDRLGMHLNFMHELGHVRDYSFRHHPYRRPFMRIMGLTSGLRGVPVSWDAAYNRAGVLVYPYELFAMAFGDCSMFPDVLPWQIAHVEYPGYDFYPRPREYRQLCSLIRGLGGH